MIEGMDNLKISSLTHHLIDLLVKSLKAFYNQLCFRMICRINQITLKKP